MSNKIEHFYDNIQGWFDFEDLYKKIVKYAKNNSIFVEIGCWKGKSSAFMATEIANSNKSIEFYCVDTWEGSEEHLDENNQAYEKNINQPNWLYNCFIENMKPVESYYIAKRKSSIEASKDFYDNSLDFVYIDASHEYEDVLNDLEAWYPKVKKCSSCGNQSGIFCGHDCHWPGVKKAIFEFSEKYNLVLKFGPREVSANSWMIYV